MTINTAFRRRYYHTPGQFVGHVRHLLARRRALRTAMRGGLVSYAFRERLMLAVTQVNDCRYCARYHLHEASKAGLSEAEVRTLLEGDLSTAPAEELPALLFAQQWAEQNGRPDRAAYESLVADYGPERAAAIESVLHVIRAGNLLGNTADYWLFRFSGGRLGRAT